MRRRAVLAASLAASLSGCALFRRRRRKAPPAVSELHSVVGRPYQAGGIWRYPAASYDRDETGLAIVADPHPPSTADGTPWDPGGLMAAHPTLQLPAIARVTNLETGRQLLLRLDDRGPTPPARMLGITERVASLLGPGTTPGVWRVRVQVEDGPSRELTARLGDPDAPTLATAAAPTTAVRTEPLGSPGRPAKSVASPPIGPVTAPDPLPPLPEQVLLVSVRPTSLWIDAGGVGQPRYAELLRDRIGGLGAVVMREPAARQELAYRVRIGPLADTAAADAMLDRVLRAGIVDARVIVL